MSAPIIQKPDKMTIHCAASKNGKERLASDIRADHIKRGFSDIGYHYVIQPNGQVELGRPLNYVGAHVEGHNTGNIGICMAGTDRFTIRQFDALRGVMDALLLTYSIPKTEIYCHYQFDTAIKQGKTCPNIPINAILIWYYKIAGEQTIAPYLLKE